MAIGWIESLQNFANIAPDMEEKVPKTKVPYWLTNWTPLFGLTLHQTPVHRDESPLERALRGSELCATSG